MLRVGILLAASLASALIGGGTAMAQPAKAPAQGVLVSAEPGDIACYLTLRDESGETRRWMAEFELCDRARARIGQRFAFTWQEGNVQHPDCQGNPDCRRTQRVLLVVGMKPLPR